LSNKKCIHENPLCYFLKGKLCSKNNFFAYIWLSSCCFHNAYRCILTRAGMLLGFFSPLLWTAVISGMMWAFFVHSTAMDVLHLVHIFHLTNQCCSVVIYSVFYKSSKYLCLGMKYCCSLWGTLFCTRGSTHFFGDPVGFPVNAGIQKPKILKNE
jgi:hypothetical protein